MGYDKSFNLNEIYITTTVTNERNVIDDHISCFERQVNNYYDYCKTKFFVFVAEWRVASGVACCECAISLCDGRSCLIIPLSNTVSVPQSLVNFLSHPNYTFVGIGIKDNVNELKNAYGIGCRNAVELGPWAARVYCNTHLTYCGVDELARAVCSLDLRNHRPLCTAFVDWGEYELNRELAKHATINVLSYQKIGSKVFNRDY